MMYRLFRPFIFRLDPERAHDLTLHALQFAQRLTPVSTLLRKMYAAPPRPVRAFGLEFSNPVGLAAGYDKDGLAWRGLACLGFGHIEVGTVTPLPQPGNPKPRVFRLPAEQALINRMGFPGKGAEFVASHLKARRPPGLILGVNLGKNKDTPLEEATRDYLALVQVFAALADYLVVNVSSPNTVGLRRLQARQALQELLGALQRERQVQEARLEKKVSVLVKLAPDLTNSELDDALQVILECGMDGVIAANTTLSRAGVQSSVANQAGGLSGAPLSSLSLETIRRIYHLTMGKLPIVGVGGIMNADDAHARLDAGATLVQFYTGLVFRGPGLVKEILMDFGT
jgi:dihydroorotate dehydrogenase